MKRTLQILAIGLFGGLMVVLVVRPVVPESEPGSPAKPVVAVTDPTSTTSDEVLSHVKPGEAPALINDEGAHARVKELEKMELARRQRDEASEKTRQARAQLQFFKSRAYAEVVQANRQTFEALRKEAAQAPDKTVPCTICDAKGVLDLCVVCDHTGKCPTCRGTGKHLGGFCPTCVGTGKCFLCFGAGKMPCPFCQSLLLRKEVITPDTPDPPAEIPLLTDPLPSGNRRLTR